MILYILFLTLFSIHHNVSIFSFSQDVSIKNWYVVDDVVMGGRSSGNFSLISEGYGRYSGSVSTENNGGFSSLRYNTPEITVGKSKKVVIRLKGDGKQYQFRLKNNKRDYHSYISNFKTSGEWENIEIPLKDLYPSFRGRKLNIDNFDADQIQEIGFLIGNKRNESFEILIDKIYLH